MEETRRLIDAIIVVLISKYSNTPMFTFNMYFNHQILIYTNIQIKYKMYLIFNVQMYIFIYKAFDYIFNIYCLYCQQQTLDLLF